MSEITVQMADRALTEQVVRMFAEHGELSGYAEAALADSDGFVLVAMDDGQLVGALVTRMSIGADRQRRGGVDEVLVRADYRSRGIGRLLMEAAEKHWRDKPDIVGMQLTVVESNSPAVRLYESMGYREVQRRVRMWKDW